MCDVSSVGLEDDDSCCGVSILDSFVVVVVMCEGTIIGVCRGGGGHWVPHE